MTKEKKIKLKGSSFFDKRKPINKTRKVKNNKVKIDKLSSKKPINKISKPKNNKGNTYKNTRPLNNANKNQTKIRYLPDIIEKRYVLIIIVTFLAFTSIGIRLAKLQVIETEEYSKKLVEATETIIEGPSTPRGRIYDRNHKLLVDNKAVKTIYYKKEDNITTKEEIELAYKVGDLINVDYSKLSERMLKTFWYKNNKEKAEAKITEKERKKYQERKLTDDDINSMIYERITKEDLSIYEEKDKKAAYIYYLMNKGYSYAEKIIKNKEVTDEEYAKISENIDSLKGFNTKLDWERIYLYNNYFRAIFGNVSSSSQGIPAELAETYLKNGYSMDDRVGISYLEYQYEKYLKGTKAKYKIKNGNYELLSDGSRGNDLVLTIDIDLQIYLEDLLAREVLETKYEINTQYYDHSFAIISDPRTGEILAMAGKQVKRDNNGEYYVVDYTPGIITMSVTPGSIVKGASMLVGYKYGAISIGEYQVDECIKIKATPEKCSWRTMGYINDIYALAFSSNVYQYKTAIKVGRGVYRYDESLSLDESAFTKYRDMYASFGLGVKTEIDLPSEGHGYKGNSKLPGHLLDFSIGQYDTYTPIEISQYINTLANGGTRLRPFLLKEIYDSKDEKTQNFKNKIYTTEVTKLNTVDVEKQYIDRVRDGFRAVIEYGLGTTYMGDYQYIGAGKTGTSQSFIDTNGDGKVDTETISTSFIGYAPYDNPRMSVVVVSPDVAVSTAEQTSTINKRISSQIINKYFEIYQ
ncbi:MAG: penicillin-binding protein 2 [Bacilli bacterium]|nr:penicillin-binding protein 2 [Bacilli bacterium]